ncbi:restriction endonuclease subunit S [Acinetobacter baumannii]|uniref:restriction endonuclease subunit S n=1 Tax=Acinetobacter baumannii TaxID=470 RepID=UPI00044DC6AC|nr:restriction endonuclease subunit S [Acinetobacter baumannii]EXE86276.1 type I restriction modification DNA specificity domain protein [Acinetobacter baumannii 532279]MDC4851292.1 restriction endonuclease subunit S [Acinetobacter baumannii]MDC4958146.1 restriction endonuclease subunit S [Acinetobacter baumannii]MDN8224677.1 restriction endonuclease subunit S [Acinetobacter baumannii]MDV4221962.1 restriction endonuclease subunit S [Acinetobacter baumannii]
MSLVFKELGELVDFKGGGTPSRNVEEYWGNSIPWATVKDLNEGITLTETQEFISELGLKNSASNLIAKGTIIIPTRMALGKVVISEIDVAINQDLKAVFVKDKETLDVKYLLRFLESNKENIASMGKGATVKGITLDQLKAIKIPLQPLAEQRRIASILDQADELRQKRQQAIEKLDQLLQATFIDMFGDPVSNPKGWRSDKNLGDVADIVSGITKGRKITGKSLREIPYLAVSNVQDKYLNLSIIKTIEASDDEIKRYKLRQGDLLLTEGGDPDKLGRGTLWNNEVDECIHQNHVFRVRLTSKEFTPNYLNWIIGSEYGKRYFLKSAKQTTGIASINMGQLKKLPLLIPPINLQIQFDERCIKIHQIKNKLVDSCKDINNLFSSLQNQAFSGTL